MSSKTLIGLKKKYLAEFDKKIKEYNDIRMHEMTKELIDKLFDELIRMNDDRA